MQLSGRRAFITFDREHSNYWFNPVVDEHKSTSSTPGFPCSRGDIFLKLGMRGARLIPWRLRKGDVFRLGQAYVLVSQIRLSADVAADVSALSIVDEAGGACADYDDGDTDVDDKSDDNGESRRPQCYICYEHGCKEDPLLNLCQCTGSVKFVHMNCLQRWMQPEGSSSVNTHCPICKARYPEKAQAMMIRPPALLLESWSNHRSLKLRHWISFSQHSTASLGRFTEQNDVVIPDHSVSGEHAFIVRRRRQPTAHAHSPFPTPAIPSHPLPFRRALAPTHCSRTQHLPMIDPPHTWRWGQHGAYPAVPSTCVIATSQVHQNDQFWLHDRESSNGSFIRLCTPLRLTFGESLQACILPDSTRDAPPHLAPPPWPRRPNPSRRYISAVHADPTSARV